MNKYLCQYAFYYPTTWLKGERIYKALQQARKFQWLSATEISAHQFRELGKMLAWAKEQSAFYRRHYDGLDLNDLSSLENFTRLPTVSKIDLVNHGDDMLTAYQSKCEVKTTGGSTGHPVKVVKNAGALTMERAVTWRGYEWAGVEIGDPQGRFWGVPHNPKGRLKAMVTDFVANRKRLSAFKLDEESLGRYYNQLKKFKPVYLYGYVSVIEALAHFMRDQDLPPLPSLKSVVTTAEVLYRQSRETIESVFGVKVYNEYGCGEVGSIAHECPHGQLHITADNLLVEIDGHGEGEILVTDLYNYKTPLIRYRLGDFGRLADDVCECGRGLPVLADVYGRAYDLLRLDSGRAIHPESLIYVVEDFKSEFDAIVQFQAVQRNHQEIDIFVVPSGRWNDGAAKILQQRMKAKLSSEIDYSIHLVEAIAREKSGKMRLVKSEVAAD